MFKRIALGLGMLAVTATLLAFGVVKFSNTSGTNVISSTSVKVERIVIASSTGTVTLGVYNATSATGAVAANKVLEIPTTSSTANLNVELFGTFTKGLVISTAGNANTVTASVVIQPNN